MCGIAGRFNYDPLRPVDRDVIEAMTDAVSHRGPDAAGYHLAPGIGLGHRRQVRLRLHVEIGGPEARDR